MRLSYNALTATGSREVNEDGYAVARHNDSYCFVLADGLGGHGNGDKASKCAVEAVSEMFELNGYFSSFFRDSFNKAQREILRLQDELKTDMKTTLIALIISKNRCFLAHVGDSRIYCFRDNTIIYQTKDHSVPQQLALMGSIQENDIRNHPDRNRLLKVLGNRDEQIEPEIAKPVHIRGELRFLLCSDGFWEPVTEEDMTVSLARSSSPEDWLKDMGELIHRKEAKNQDNYTAITVFVKNNSLFGLF